MDFIGRYFLRHIAGVILFFVVSLPADTNNENDIRWDNAAAEVDSLQFSAAYIDSVRDTLKCPAQKIPLRVIVDKSTFAPETLVYSVSWGPFNAGYVILTTLHDSTTCTIQVGAKVVSNNFVSNFYRMRDYIISTIDADGLYPIFFEQHLREGKKYKSNEYLLYDLFRQKIYVKTRKKFRTMDSTGTFVHDYLSVLNFIRAVRKLAPGDTFSERLYVHNKVYPITFSVSDSKDKEVEAGNFSCVLITPKLVGDGKAFNAKDQLEVWISNDQQRIPVAIRSKIKVGAINAKLIWMNKKKNQALKPMALVQETYTGNQSGKFCMEKTKLSSAEVDSPPTHIISSVSTTSGVSDTCRVNRQPLSPGNDTVNSSVVTADTSTKKTNYPRGPKP